MQKTFAVVRKRLVAMDGQQLSVVIGGGLTVSCQTVGGMAQTG
jgi:hypothetical protein